HWFDQGSIGFYLWPEDDAEESTVGSAMRRLGRKLAWRPTIGDRRRGGSAAIAAAPEAVSTETGKHAADGESDREHQGQRESKHRSREVRRTCEFGGVRFLREHSDGGGCQSGCEGPERGMAQQCCREADLCEQRSRQRRREKPPE